jgi:predicted metal-dependent hydrolase
LEVKSLKEPEPRADVRRAHGQSPRTLQTEPTSRFLAGVELIRAGEYFAAHEELEDAWRAAPAEERDFFQGLVHVAVAWYQAGRGRKIGTERQLAKALRRLEPFAPTHRGIELQPLLAQLRQLHEQGSLELPRPLL